jgi:hypothetical protein
VISEGIAAEIRYGYINYAEIRETIKIRMTGILVIEQFQLNLSIR